MGCKKVVAANCPGNIVYCRKVIQVYVGRYIEAQDVVEALILVG